MDNYKRALGLDASLSEAAEKLVVCHSQVGQVKPSLASRKEEELTSGVSKAERKEIAEGDVKSLQTRGYAALKAGNTEFAILALTKAVQLEPNNPLTRRYLAYAMVTAGDGSGALQQFYAWDKLQSIAPGDAVAFAKTLAFSGDSTNAKIVFDYTTAKNSNDVQALLEIARICAVLRFDGQATSAVTAGLMVARRFGKREVQGNKRLVNSICLQDPELIRCPLLRHLHKRRSILASERNGLFSADIRVQRSAPGRPRNSLRLLDCFCLLIWLLMRKDVFHKLRNGLRGIDFQRLFIFITDQTRFVFC